jgi:hypothetical protein
MSATKLDLLVNELDEARITLQRHRKTLLECRANTHDWHSTMRLVEYFTGIVIGLGKAVDIETMEGDEHDMD